MENLLVNFYITAGKIEVLAYNGIANDMNIWRCIAR